MPLPHLAATRVGVRICAIGIRAGVRSFHALVALAENASVPAGFFDSAVIYCTRINLAFGGDVIFRDLSWVIPRGKRIGLIGPNGAGKSTLLRMIAGRIKPDSGEISMEGDVSIGYLEQDVQEADPRRSVLDEAMMAFEEVLALEAEIERISTALDAELDHTTPLYERLLHQLDRAQAQLGTRDAHLARPQAESVLTGLGFDPDELERPLSTYSGGWRMRATLARLLLRRPDVLLLDEPTNHLDIESIDWVEQYLRDYDGTVVIVSHDRYFLDRMVNHISEIAHSVISDYAGNYAYYLEARTERRALQQSAHDNQQRQIIETERFIERFRYKASKAKQVQSRIKQLERLERIPPPPADEASIGFRFPEPPKSGRTVLELSRFSKTYPSDAGTIQVFENAGPLTIERGDKIALIGKNGAGKSTLARMLNGTEPFDGTRAEGYKVEMTFFAQHQAETLNPVHTVLQSLEEAAPRESETRLRTLLGAFLFRGDDVFKPVGVLSGGERSRLSLARTLLSPANFLILDEPTNHLDIHSIQVLVEALKQYAGTFVVVSHDRHFLDQVATTVWAAGGGDVTVFPGTYSDFRESRLGAVQQSDAPTQSTNGQTARAPEASSGPKSKEQKRLEAEERKRLNKLIDRGEVVDTTKLSESQVRRLVEKVEGDISQAEVKRDRLEAEMTRPDVYEDPDRMRAVKARHDDVTAHIHQLMERWEELAGLLTE
jgi:ATP-binding cassette, subfamily F, member 3